MADDVQYEFKSVRAIRGTESRTIAKWQKAGWELDTQSQGPLLRTDLTFRRVKPKTLGTYLSAFGTESWAAFRRLKPSTQRRLLAVSSSLVLLVVIIGVVAGIKGGGTSEPTATRTEAAVVPSEKPSEKPSQQSQENDSEPAPTQSATQEILTVENNKDLAALLAVSDPGADTVKEFAAKYHGKTIEFDGNICAMNHHGTYKTRYDILACVGNYSTSSSSGPNFQFKDVNVTFDLHLTGANIPDTIGVGQNLHIVAEVKDYNSTQQLFFLKPVSTEVR